MDAVTKVTHFCTTPAGTVLGGLVGFLLGSAWYTVFNSSGAGNLLYFDEMESNAVVCKGLLNKHLNVQLIKMVS